MELPPLTHDAATGAGGNSVAMAGAAGHLRYTETRVTLGGGAESLTLWAGRGMIDA